MGEKIKFRYWIFIFMVINYILLLSKKGKKNEYIGKNKNTNLKRYMSPNVHRSTVYNSQLHKSNPSGHQQTTGLRRCGTYRWPIGT